MLPHFEVRLIRKPLLTAVSCYSGHELETPVFRLGGPGVFLFPCAAHRGNTRLEDWFQEHSAYSRMPHRGFQHG